MRTLIFLLLFSATGFAQDGIVDLVDGQTKAVQAAPKVVVPFEEILPFDELPDSCYAMPRKVYMKWAKLQNKGAYRQAQRMADAFSARNPYVDTYVQTSDYSAGIDQEQHEKVTPKTADFSGTQKTNYSGRNAQYTFRRDRWAGGPVNLLNPYSKRPPKVMFGKTGMYLADPDGVVKTPEQARKILEAAL